MQSGIYKITNLQNNKIYIGSSKNLKARENKHKNGKNNSIISRAIFKYGWDNFIFEIIEYCDVNELIERENYYLDYYQPFKENGGYNILRTATSNGWINHKHDIISRKKMSDSKKGIIPWNKGTKGLQIPSQKTRVKMSDSKKGINNPFYGKNHSKQSKKKMSNSAKLKDMSRFNKRVVQIDKNTDEIITVHESISKASLSIVGHKEAGSNISAACKGKYKTAMGFKWEYYNY